MESLTCASDHLVVFCGGSELHRIAAQDANREIVSMSAPIAVGDVQALLRCATRSGAVIVCGDLAGVSASTVERLIKQHAPQARLVRADR